MPETESRLYDVMQALATQIQNTLCGTADPVIEQLQVVPLLTFNPTPPAIDIYPAEPFQERIAMGKANSDMNFTIRARVDTAEHQGAQQLLLAMMDPEAPESVLLAVASDHTLGGEVESATIVSGPSDYGVFVDPGGKGALLGCTWRARVFP